MCSSSRTCDVLRDYLSAIDPHAARGSQGRVMMERRLKLYLWWKGKLSENKRDGRGAFHMPGPQPAHSSTQDGASSGISEALRKKDEARRERNASRRRVRGGAPAGVGGKVVPPPSLRDGVGREGMFAGEGEMRIEADNIADL